MGRGKRKKRRLRKRKTSVSINRAKDLHHLCYQRRSWGEGFALALRGFWYCKMEIPRESLHKEIHYLVPIIPVPRKETAKDALEHLMLLEKYKVISKNDSLSKRLLILSSLFECCDQRTADGFKAQLEVARRFEKAPRS